MHVLGQDASLDTLFRVGLWSSRSHRVKLLQDSTSNQQNKTNKTCQLRLVPVSNLAEGEQSMTTCCWDKHC